MGRQVCRPRPASASRRRKPLQPFQNCSGRSGTYHLARDETEDDFSDGDDGDGGDGNRGDLSSADVPDPTKSRPLPPPKRRTPAETIVVNFLVNAIAAVAMQIQSVQSAPVCVADAPLSPPHLGPPSRLGAAFDTHLTAPNLPSSRLDASGSATSGWC